jgi:hypothetical protein
MIDLGGRIEGQGDYAMMPSRVVLLALVLTAVPLAPAAAQFGGMPGMPGSPGMSPGAGSPFGQAPQQGPPPACQQLITARDETQKHGQALAAAGQKKLPPEEVCKLFKVFIASETKMVKGLKDNATTCGVPPEVIKQVETQHNKASQMAKQVCDVAAQGARPSGPSLSEALGTTPAVPDSSQTKRGAGTFDTLQGSPLTR